MKILILGANGMLGHVIFNYLTLKTKWKIFGTVRSKNKLNKNIHRNLYLFDLSNKKNILRIINILSPNLIINCIGVVKQNNMLNDISSTIYANSLFVHELYDVCKIHNIRLIHFSTDCVFSGKEGNYFETDKPDATDLYGRTKFLGEINYEGMLTLRTSFLGHQIDADFSLLQWFLKQKGSCYGYQNAIYSGLPTVEIASILMKHVIPNEEIFGLYHLSSEPINKYELLKIIKKIYGLNLLINKDKTVRIDRSLNSDRFKKIVKYKSPSWNDMIKKMFKYRKLSYV